MTLRRPHLTPLQKAEATAFILLLCITLMFALIQPGTALQQVKARGELIVATRIGNTTYQIGPDRPFGFEYDMLRAFADELGVELRLVFPDTLDAMLRMTARGRVDLAAAGITVTQARRQNLRFGPSYMDITEQVIARTSDSGTISTPADLEGRRIAVVAGSSHEETLRQLQNTYPGIIVETFPDVSPEQLLRMVREQEVDLTVSDSMELNALQRFYPELRVALDLQESSHQLAWAFPRSNDLSLLRAARVFFDEFRANGRLEQLLERYFGHLAMLDHAGVLTFNQRLETVLPRFEPLFREAAETHGLDWRLIAAMSYQESHWNPDAVSRTGVRGLMMLTLETANELGIADRTDPRSSVMGGTRYLINIRDRLPESIPEPDRTWMSLAAYNVGLGHLYDARTITRQQGRDPDRWIDVMEHLPLLSQEQWYTQTRLGYARGWEPVQYVQNIRSFYDMLIWASGDGEPADLPGTGSRTGSFDVIDILPPGL